MSEARDCTSYRVPSRRPVLGAREMYEVRRRKPPERGEVCPRGSPVTFRAGVGEGRHQYQSRRLKGSQVRRLMKSGARPTFGGAAWLRKPLPKWVKITILREWARCQSTACVQPTGSKAPATTVTPAYVWGPRGTRGTRSRQTHAEPLFNAVLGTELIVAL